MEVINLTPSVKMVSKQVGTRVDYVFEFGSVKQDKPATFKAKIENVTAKSVRRGCSICTKAEANQMGSDVELEATYDAKSKGVFNKTVFLTLEDNTEIKFILNGTVK